MDTESKQREEDIKAINELLIEYREMVVVVNEEVESRAIAAIKRLSGEVVKPASVERNTCPQCGKDTTGSDRMQGAWCYRCLQEGGE